MTEKISRIVKPTPNTFLLPRKNMFTACVRNNSSIIVWNNFIDSKFHSKFVMPWFIARPHTSITHIVTNRPCPIITSQCAKLLTPKQVSMSFYLAAHEKYDHFRFSQPASPLCLAVIACTRHETYHWHTNTPTNPFHQLVSRPPRDRLRRNTQSSFSAPASAAAY